jgi:hypothetical protein
MSQFGEYICDPQAIKKLIEEQRSHLSTHEITEKIGAQAFLLGDVALSCVQDSSLYKAFPAKAKINTKTDNLEVIIDTLTIEEMVEELVNKDGLSREDVVRMYVGIGLSNLLLAGRFPAKPTAVKKFFKAITEPQGLFNRTMDSPIFDKPGRLETVQTLIVGTDEQIARVNGLRLATGTFLEVQPDSKEIRRKIETNFQFQLEGMFDGKGMYLKTVELFGVEGKEGENMYADNATNTLALSFPMNRKEVSEMLKFYR